MRVFITGGTGLVGKRLIPRLQSHGHTVVLLSRRVQANAAPLDGTEWVQGDPTQRGPWLEKLATCDAVIHLAGESIAAGRWTTAFKKKILDSRVLSTTLLATELAQQPRTPSGTAKVLLTASGVGYYGSYTNNTTEFIESDLPGSGFLADVCVQWEGSTQAARDAGVRVAIVRLGVVLAADGGALPKIVAPFRWFLGGSVGGGKQWMSWIHVDDVAGLFVHALQHPNAQGPINGTAPEPLTNWGFSKTVGNVLGRPCWFPVPAFGLRLMLGEMAELVTHGQRVISTQAKALGYEFQYPLLEQTLRQILTPNAVTPS